MGWTFETASFYKPDGTVDRKAQCDSYYNGTNRAGTVFKVLKSAMVGSTYYAAVEITHPQRPCEREVYCAVVLTSSDKAHGYNFGYKDMDESMGPCERKCPNGILDLLTSTKSEYALKWREDCRAYNAKKRAPDNLSKLPIGTVITYTGGNGPVKLVKRAPAYQFKTPWWYRPDNNTYMPKNHIPQDYVVVSKPATDTGMR